MARSVMEVKRDIDKKFKEINGVRKKMIAAQAKLERDKSKMAHFGILDAETAIGMMGRDIKRLESEMSKIELEAYGTWLPKIRELKAAEADKDAIAEHRRELHRVYDGRRREREREARMTEADS